MENEMKIKSAKLDSHATLADYVYVYRTSDNNGRDWHWTTRTISTTELDAIEDVAAASLRASNSPSHSAGNTISQCYGIGVVGKIYANGNAQITDI